MQKPHLSFFRLLMITLAFIMSIRSLPMLAETGWQQIFYLIAAAVLFLVPAALLSAELATGWPDAGGIYVWIKTALGKRWGFVAAWMLWVQMFFAMVVVGSFVASMIAYVFNPALAQNNLFLAGVIVSLYWLVTIFNLRGLRASSFISSFGFIGGVLLPYVLVLVFGALYYLSGAPVALPPFTWREALPNFSSLNHLTLFVGILFVYAGITVPSVHANQVRNVRRNYPLAMFVAAIVLVVLNVFGTFAVEIVLPKEEISLTAGVMQTFDLIFAKIGYHWLSPIVAGLAALGALGELNTWVLGPSKAMLEVARDGAMPRWFSQTNSRGVPSRFMFVQATMISLIALIYVWIPEINSSFFMVLVLAMVIYSVMYILLYISGIVLRYRYPQVPRAYRIPGGKWGIWIVCLVGLLTVFFALVVSLFPPSNLTGGTPAFYTWFMAAGFVVFVVPPLLIYAFRKPSWTWEDSAKNPNS